MVWFLQTQSIFSTSSPLASSRWVRSTFSSHCPLSSQQHCWLTSSTSTIFSSEKNCEHWESNVGQLGLEASILTMWTSINRIMKIQPLKKLRRRCESNPGQLVCSFDWRTEQVWNGSRQERDLGQGTEIKRELPVLHHRLTHVDNETNCHEDNCRGEQSPVRMSK